MGELYRLDFASGKSYVGISRRSASVRFGQHASRVRNGSTLPVHLAWRKHGEPTLVVIAVHLGEQQLLDAERAAIADLGTLHPGGYNLGPGGDVPASMNPDVAKKISTSLTGKKLSPAHVAARAAAQVGLKRSEKTKAAQRAAQAGRTFSEEARTRMSLAATGRKHSPETRERMAASQRARRQSEALHP